MLITTCSDTQVGQSHCFATLRSLSQVPSQVSNKDSQLSKQVPSQKLEFQVLLSIFNNVAFMLNVNICSLLLNQYLSHMVMKRGAEVAPP